MVFQFLCLVRVEDAVTSCVEGDGEMRALRRLPEFQGVGRSGMYEYLRSLLNPGQHFCYVILRRVFRAGGPNTNDLCR